MGRRALPTDEMNLTERERSMLDYMKRATIEKGYPPTVREICNELGIKSTSTVHKDMASLEKKGFIKKDPAKPRAVEIVGLTGSRSMDAGAMAQAGLAARQAGIGLASRGQARDGAAGMGAQHAHSDGVYAPDVIEVPLIGQVAAGTPILAEENITDSFPVPARYVNANGTHFMLVVKGESMIEAGIFDGDYILVKQQSEARNGDMVVAMIDGFESEATVKTFYNEGDHIRLQPENSTMSPIIVKDVKILGTVKGVFRYLS